MKQRQVIKIDEKEITIKELTIKELLYLCYRTGWISDAVGIDFEEQFKQQKDLPLPDLVLSFVSDISKQEVLALAPSEIKELYNLFMKTNAVTFSLAQYLGLDMMLENAKSELVKTFMMGYADLAKKEFQALSGKDKVSIKGKVSRRQK